MQYKFLTLSALAATAFAQNSTQSQQDLVSVISVLQTALPSSLIQEALTNSAAVSSQIASEFSAGNTPAWFTALPSDVQSYLVPAASYPNATGSVISAGPTNSANSTGGSGNSTTLRTSSRAPTTITSTASGSGSEETGSSGSGSSSGSEGSSSSSTGGASMPTNIMGLGVAGAVGLVGVLAL